MGKILPLHSYLIYLVAFQACSQPRNPQQLPGLPQIQYTPLSYFDFFFPFPSKTCFESPLFFFFFSPDLSFCRSCRSLLPASLFPSCSAICDFPGFLSKKMLGAAGITKWKTELSFLCPRKVPLQENCTEYKHLLWAEALNHYTLCCKQCSASHQRCTCHTT